MASNSIKVFVKVRPLIDREKNENASSVWKLTGNTLKSTDKEHEMTFDHIYDETRSTEDLFEDLAKPIVTSALKGINGTIFAYGQTSSGKTYTMMGDTENPGIIPLTVHEIFEQIEGIEDREFLLRIGYIEIYNEKIFDLLDEKKPECQKIHEPNPGEVTVNQKEVISTCTTQILEFYEKGNRARRTGETNMNERSSRSHTIFRITIESREIGKEEGEENAVQVSNLNLVDLAGSERADQTKAEGDRLKEGGHINKSLLSLGNVIRILSDDQSVATTFINYRDSKLTRILSASLGGNAMTSIICTITPAALEETYSTLVFAQNAKMIKNKPKVNEVMTDQVLMMRMKREIQKLKDELNVEKTLNTKLQKIKELKEQILQREGQFLHSHNMTSVKIDVARRRTWCPSSSNVAFAFPASRELPPVPSFLLPKERRSDNNENIGKEEGQEMFVAASSDFFNTERLSDFFNTDERLPSDQLSSSTGERDTAMLTNLIRTPRGMKKMNETLESPNPKMIGTNEGLLARISYLEEEIRELNDFKKIENTVEEDRLKLAGKLRYAQDHTASLELKIEELKKTIADNNKDLLVKNAQAERDKAIKAREIAENIAVSTEYDFDTFKARAKKREAELVQCLDEVRSESKVEELQAKIESLEEQLKQKPDVNGIDFLAGGDSIANVRAVELEAAVKTANDKAEELQNEIMSLTDKIKDLEFNKQPEQSEHTEDLQSKIEAAAEKIALLSAKLSEAAEKASEDEKKFFEVNARIEEAVANLHTAIERAEEAEMKLQDSDSKLLTAEERAFEFEEKLFAATQEVEETKENLHASEQRAAAAEAKIVILEEIKLQVATERAEESENKLRAANEQEEQKMQSLQEKIAEIENALQAANDAEYKAKRAFEDKKNELASLTKEYDDLSNQMMDTVQENDNLAKQLESLIETNTADLTVRCQFMDQIIQCIHNDEQPPEMPEDFATDESIDMLMQFRTGFMELRSQDSLLQEMQIEIERLKSENDVLKMKLPSIEESSTETESELKDKVDFLTYELNETKTQFDAKDEKIWESEEAMQKLQKDYEELIQKNERLLREIEALKETEPEEKNGNDSEKETLMEDLKNKLSSLTYEIINLETLVNEKNSKIKELEDATASQEGELASAIAEMKDGLQQVLSLGQENARLKMVEKDHKRMVNDITQKMDQMEASQVELEARKGLYEIQAKSIEQFKSNEAIHQKKIEELEAEIAKNNESLTRLEFDNEILVESNAVLKKAAEDYDDGKEQYLDLDVRVHELQAEVENLREELVAKSKDLENASINTSQEFETLAQVAVLEQQVEELKLKVAEANEKITSLEAELKIAYESKEEFTNTVATLAQEISTHRDVTIEPEIKIKVERDLEPSPALLDRSAEISDLRDEIQQLCFQREELSAKLSTADASIKSLDAELVESRELANCELDLMKTRLDDLQNKVDKKEESISILEGLIKDKNQEIATLSLNLESMEKESKEVDNLKKQLAQLESEHQFLKSSSAEVEALRADFEAIKAEKLARDEEFETLTKRANDLIAESNEARKLNKDLELGNSKIDAENTNLKSKILILEEEVKKLNVQLKEKTDECDDVKARYRRRSCDNDKKIQALEMSKTELMQEIGAVQAKKALIESELQKLRDEHSHLIEQQIPRLQSENEHMRNTNSDNDVKYALLDEKFSQLSEHCEKLQLELDQMRKKNQQSEFSVAMEATNTLELLNSSLKKKNQEQAAEMVTHLNLISSLREEMETLQLQLDEHKKKSLKKSLTPDKRDRLSNELYASQNELNVVEAFKSTPSRAVDRNAERKNRRQSVHDEHRRLSVWERFTDSGCQTDAVSDICACSELTQKVKELQIEIRKRDSKLATIERKLQHNPLKLDLDEAKKTLAREQREHNVARHTIDSLQRNVSKLEHKIEVLSQNQIVQKVKTNQGTQANDLTLIEKAEYDRMEQELNDVKRMARQHQEKIDELQETLGKENISRNGNDNRTMNENQQLKNKMQELEEKHSQVQTDDVKASVKTDYENLKNDFDKLQKKYDMTRRLCNLRNDDISKLKAEIDALKSQYDQVQTVLNSKNGECAKLQGKYAKMKELCQMRLDKLNNLRAEYGAECTQERE